jgi:hypothetical protein
MSEDILEVEVELGNGDKVAIKIQKEDDWYNIPKGTRGIIMLVNGQVMLVNINSADEDEGVSFNIIGGTGQSYHYDAGVVNEIYVEVKEETFKQQFKNKVK